MPHFNRSISCVEAVSGSARHEKTPERRARRSFGDGEARRSQPTRRREGRRHSLFGAARPAAAAAPTPGTPRGHRAARRGSRSLELASIPSWLLHTVAPPPGQPHSSRSGEDVRDLSRFKNAFRRDIQLQARTSDPPDLT